MLMIAKCCTRWLAGLAGRGGGRVWVVANILWLWLDNVKTNRVKRATTCCRSCCCCCLTSCHHHGSNANGSCLGQHTHAQHLHLTLGAHTCSAYLCVFVSVSVCVKEIARVLVVAVVALPTFACCAGAYKSINKFRKWNAIINAGSDASCDASSDAAPVA